ncbi:MAG: hypothetical protein IH944_13250 [Armatimonadetes bacterium]|nr:hypothetical protein [Armatimonadota bacterium]
MLSFAFFLVAQASAVDNQLTVADFEEATKVLRVAGLQFPGDGEYRTVTLELLTFRFGPSEIKLNGWIVIDEYTGKKSFLAWNGIKYDEFEVGPAASVEEDLERSSAIVEAKRFHFFVEHRPALHPTSKIAALLLHSLGLEERAVAAALHLNFPQIKGGIVTEALQQYDQILTINAALQIKFGRYQEAYLQTRSLRRFRNLFDEVLEAKGVRLRRIPRKGLSNHWIIDAWLVDIRRRLVDARTPEMSLEEIARLPQGQQIEALVEGLDDSVGFRPPQQRFESASLSPDGMLESFGQAAVAALIPHMNDKTASRAVGKPGLTLGHPVFATTGSVCVELVEFALSLSPLPAKAGLYDLELIARYWDSVRELPIEEQWLRALEFDGFGPGIWLAAAENLSIPPWVTITGIGGRRLAENARIEVDTPRHKWASLDERAHDRVVRAIESRTRTVLDSVDRQNPPMVFIQAASKMSVALAAWDLEASTTIVAEVLRHYLEQESSPFIGPEACALTSALICAGDDSGWDIYEALLERIQRDARSDYDKLFAPLWQHYDDPRAKQIAQRIFSGDDGWNATMIVARSFARLPTVALLPEFRRSLLPGFDDTDVATTAVRFSERTVSYAIPTGGSASRSIDPAGTTVPVGGEFEIRWCDLLAIKLSRTTISEGGFDVAWPVNRRDIFISNLRSDMARDDFNWSKLPERQRPRIYTFDPVFATSLPPRPRIETVDRFGVRPRFNIVEPGIVHVRLGSSEVRKFGRWGRS